MQHLSMGCSAPWDRLASLQAFTHWEQQAGSSDLLGFSWRIREPQPLLTAEQSRTEPPPRRCLYGAVTAVPWEAAAPALQDAVPEP